MLAALAADVCRPSMLKRQAKQGVSRWIWQWAVPGKMRTSMK